jgi:hypothetical protein
MTIKPMLQKILTGIIHIEERESQSEIESSGRA